MLTYSYLQGVEPPPRRPATDAVKRRAPSKKLLLNSRENAVGSQTPRAYLLELASAARRTLPTSLSYSECGTQRVSFGPHRDDLVRERHGDLTGEHGASAG